LASVSDTRRSCRITLMNRSEDGSAAASHISTPDYWVPPGPAGPRDEIEYIPGARRRPWRLA
jgi:hypothetical protein